MNFLVDAQLPRRLALWLCAAGYSSVHTLDLPKGNETSDEDINTFSLQTSAIVITKDADFVNSFLIQNKPYKLLLISTGNIANRDLELIFQQNIQQIADLFNTYFFLELSLTKIIVHI